MLRQTFAVIVAATLIQTASAADYVVDVHGIVCEFCSLGVAKKVRKLTFVDPTRFDKGVKVDIKHQRVFVAVRDDQSLDKDALFDAIESGGYQPIAVRELDADTGTEGSP